MSSFEHENYTYLQIDRPITSGADELQRRLHALGKRYLSTVHTTALPETVLKMKQTESQADDVPEKFVMSSRPLKSPLLEVFHARNISVVLFRRVVHDKDRMRFRFGHIAEEAERDFGLLDELRQIGYSRNMDPEQSSTICNRAAFVDDVAWGKTLVLLPDETSKGGALLSDQAIVAEYKLPSEMPDLTQLPSFTTPSVPVASYHLRTNTPDETKRLDEFAETVSETLLPVKVAIDGVRAYKSYMQSTIYSQH